MKLVKQALFHESRDKIRTAIRNDVFTLFLSLILSLIRLP